MSKKILSPLRRDGYKAGMIMMLIALSTMLLTTACSSEDDLANNTANTENTINKGYALPVTVSATRGGDATRATFDGSKLNFSAGDKLYVFSYDGGSAGRYAGVLDWVSDGTFSGTIYTQNSYEGTIDALLSGGDPAVAVLLPAGYGDYGYLSTEGNSGSYSDGYKEDYTKAFVASTTEKTAKALAVEQFSFESKEYKSGSFALKPNNAILNFTITGLTASTNVTATIKKGEDVLVSGSVTTDGSGNATFAMGIKGSIEINPLTLTVGGKEITITSANRVFDAGKIYNISRSAASIPEGAISGQFSVSSTKKVYFSKGNLQAKIASYASNRATASEWKFADSQYSYIGNAAGNTTFATDTWVDLFSWVGNSASNNTYGLITFGSSSQANHGNVADESLKTDWGTAAASSIGEGWRTLTSAEWTYLFNTRTVNNGTGSGKSYTWGKSVNGVLGVVLYPDDYTGAEYSGSDWSDFESAGCVFLPAAGRRNGTSVYTAGTYGGYWSSTAHGTGIAYDVYFYSDSVDPAKDYERVYGFSVRLVRDVQ